VRSASDTCKAPLNPVGAGEFSLAISINLISRAAARAIAAAAKKLDLSPNKQPLFPKGLKRVAINRRISTAERYAQNLGFGADQASRCARTHTRAHTCARPRGASYKLAHVSQRASRYLSLTVRPAVSDVK